MMKREIKFRAYCSTDDGLEMIYFGNMQCDNGLWFNSEKHIDNYESNIMQFTGLTDKNGKEIYEGDIIKHKDPGYSSEKWEVIFYSGSFWLAGLPRKIRIYNIGERQNECEVISNVHENPELI